MTERKRGFWIGFRGPLLLAIGSTILTVASTFLLASAISGYLSSAAIQWFIIEFCGFLLAGLGLQLIVDNRTRQNSTKD